MNSALDGVRATLPSRALRPRTPRCSSSSASVQKMGRCARAARSGRVCRYGRIIIATDTGPPSSAAEKGSSSQSARYRFWWPSTGRAPLAASAAPAAVRQPDDDAVTHIARGTRAISAPGACAVVANNPRSVLPGDIGATSTPRSVAPPRSSQSINVP